METAPEGFVGVSRPPPRSSGRILTRSAAKNIRVSPDEVRRLHGNRTHKVQTSDGYYVGALGAYHELHCLDVLRRLLHWDYYGVTLSEEERRSFLYTHKHSGAICSVLLPADVGADVM